MSHRSGGYIRLWLITLGSILATSVHADDPARWYTAQQLYNLCSPKTDSCFGYIDGVADMMILDAAARKVTPYLCLPDGIQAQQLVPIVTGFIEKHPISLSHTAAGSVYLALREAFPCQS